MCYYDGRLLLILNKCLAQPSELLVTQITRRNHRLLQRVQQEESRRTSLNDGDVARSDWRPLRLLLREHIVEHLTVIMIPQREVDRKASFPEWVKKLLEQPVVARLTVAHRKISIDQDGGRSFLQGQ